MWSKQQPDKNADITKNMADRGDGGVTALLSNGEKMSLCGGEARSVYFWCLSSGVASTLHYVGAAGGMCPLLSALRVFAHRGS